MNPQSTDKITEDTAGLQRKIVYRGVIETDLVSGFTNYLQEDGVSTFAVGTLTETIPELSVINSSYSVDFVWAYINAPYNYQMFKGNYVDGGGPYTQNNTNVVLSSDGGKLKLTFNVKSSSNIGVTSYLYYVIYSTRITEDSVL